MHQHFSDPYVVLEHPAKGETRSRSGSVLVQKSGHVDDDVQISAMGAFCENDGRRSRYIGEVFDWYREDDAGDLNRSELIELVENLTCLTPSRGKCGKVTRTSWWMKNWFRTS